MDGPDDRTTIIVWPPKRWMREWHGGELLTEDMQVERPLSRHEQHAVSVGVYPRDAVVMVKELEAMCEEMGLGA